MKNIIIGLAVVVVAIGIFAGLKYPIAQTFGTTAGTASTAKVAEFSFNPTTSSATSSSILNSDAQDRVITSVNQSCSGIGSSVTAYSGGGLAAFIFSLATTSASAPAALGNTNYVYNGTVATSSVTFYDASTTPGLTSSTQIGVNRRWPTGTYLTETSNATNTAACITTVYYLQGLGV